jgi:hypothetical protein
MCSCPRTLELFHGASPAVFLHLANRQDFKEETIVALLTHAFDNLPTEFLGMAQPSFWHRVFTASGPNRAAIRKHANALAAIPAFELRAGIVK